MKINRIAYQFPLLLLAFGGMAQAAPQGGEITSGSGQIQTPDAQTTIVNQQSQTLSINWQSLNLNSDELLQFNQPNQQSISLNHILDQNPSQIQGQINANGRVFLMNPNGVVFGETARINVGGLVAGAFQLDAEQLQSLQNSPDYLLDIGDGSVENYGQITVSEGGEVALLGNNVLNSGSIDARLGRIHLLSAEQASMSFDQDGMIQFAITRQASSNSSESDSAVENRGTLQADGGYVVMEAQAANNVFVNVVNNSGVIHATRITDEGGVVRLEGMGGNVVTTGDIIASGEGLSSGGSVSLMGDRVGVVGDAVIDASGETGGGTIHIGGELQGAGDNTAQFTVVGADARIQANALRNGDGGEIIVWADDTTLAKGEITATGGSESGNGGFIEVSGKQGLVFEATIDLRAANGEQGTLLLDPTNITVHAASTNTTNDTELSDNQILAGEGGATDFNISEDALEALLDTADIVLQATENITINTLSDGSLDLQANSGSITFTADSNADGTGDFTMDRSDAIVTQGGAITISGANVTVGSLSGGPVTLLGTAAGTLSGPNQNTSWTIDGANTGDLGSASFSNFGNLVGGSADDNFVITGVGNLSGQIDGGGHSSGDTANYSAASVVGSVTINSDVVNIENLIGGAAYDTLNGDNANNTWTITGLNDGVVGGVTFTDFAILNGGNGDDAFVLSNLSASISDTISGGGGSDSLTAQDASNTWIIDSPDAGSVTNVFNFDSIETLIGGSGADTFQMTAPTSSVSVMIDGGGGSDTLVARAGANTWDIDGANTGNVTGVALFQNMENLTGNSNADDFTFSDTSSSVSGTINGGAGVDSVDLSVLATVTVNLGNGSYANIEQFTGNDTDSTLIGPNLTNNWVINNAFDGVNDGTLGGSITFIDFNNLTGGTGDDVFTLSNGTLDGVIDGGLGNDEIAADNIDNTWLINSASVGSGDVNGIGSFVNIEDLTGNAGIDQFLFSGGGSVAGTVDGGANDDVVDYSTEAGTVSVTIGTGGFINIESFTGNNTDSTLTGGSNDNNWIINGENDGQITDLVTADVIDFVNFNNITGGVNTDTFRLQGGNISGTLDGGAGTDTLVADTLATNTWTISDTDTGQVTGATGLTAFINTENLTGNLNVDNYVFGVNGAVSGIINGAAGSDSINLAAKATVSIDLDSGNYLSIETYTGNNTDSTLIGTDADTTWNIIGENDFTINAVSFFDFNHLVGNDSADTFDFGPSGDILGSINGGAGNDIIQGRDSGVTWTITGADVGNATAVAQFSFIETLQGGTGIDTFVFDNGSSFTGTMNGGAGPSVDVVNLSALDAPVVVNLDTNDYQDIESFIGEGSNSTLIGENITNSWTISAPDSGDINGIAFSGFTDLTGNNLADDFVFTGTGALTGNIDGGAGIDSLTAKNTVNDWLIDNPNSGSLTDVGGFSNIENIIGGSDVDTFEYVSSGDISGSVNGAGGIDIADLNALASVTVTLGSSGFTNVESFIGNNVDSTLIAALGNNNWVITGDNDGTVGTVSFTNFNNITGNSSNDDFVFQDGGVINGLVDGAGGFDTGDFSALTIGSVDIDLGGTDYVNIETFYGSTNGAVTNTLTGADLPNDWSITGNGSGTIDDGSTTSAFFDFDTIVGGSDVDTFTLGISGTMGLIDGGGDSDIIAAPNTINSWEIIGTDGGTLNGVTFQNIENLVGNANTDTFHFNSGSDITGSVDGGAGIDTTDQQDQLGIINIVLGSSGYLNVENFIGNGANSTLTADNINNAWTIDGIDSGTIGTSNFTNVANLQGGSANDDFTVTTGGYISGQIDGGAGAGTDTLEGPNAGNLWDITGVEVGKLTSGTDGVNQFSEMETLIGNGGIDTFVFADGSSFSGIINGAGGLDTLNVASQNSDTVISLASGQYQNIENFIGNSASANSTLVGENNINAWSIFGTNAGSVDGVTFSGFNHLLGNASADTFTLQSGGSITGSVDGGAGTNTIQAFNINNTWNITATNAGNVNGIASFQNINNLVGNSSVDTFNLNANLSGNAEGGGGDDIFNVTAAITVGGSLIGGAGIDTLVGPNIASSWTVTGQDSGLLNGIDFTQVENLTGGSAADSFAITNSATAALSGAIDAGDGDDSLSVDYTAASTRNISFDGGLGSDDIALTGAAANLVNSYVFGPGAGDVAITSTNLLETQVVTASNVDSVVDSMTADSIAIVGSISDDTITLSPGSIGGTQPISMTAPSLLPLEFSNKTNLSLDTAFGNDSITINGAIALPGDMTFTTEALIEGALGSISADNLILANVGTTGTSGTRLQTNINNLQVTGTAADVYITEQNGLSVAASNVTNVFDISTLSGDISSSGPVIVTGASYFNVGNGGSIILDNASNQFAGTPVFTSAGVLNNLTVVDNSSIDLPNLTIGGDLSITANGITQSGALNVQGDSVFSAGSNVISLGDSLNDFNGTVSLQNSGNNNVTLSDQNALVLANSSVGSGTLTVTAGSISQSGPMVQQANAGATRFTSNSGGLVLDDLANDFTGVVSLINNSSFDTLITESNHLLLGSSTTNGGDLIVTVDNGITLSGTTVSNDGDITVTANTGNIQLGRLNAGDGKITLHAVTGDVLGNNSPITDPNLTAHDLEIVAGQVIGDFNNPISVKIAADGTSFFDTGEGSAHIIGFPGTILSGSVLVNDVAFTSLAIAKGQSVAFVPNEQFVGAEYFLLPLYTFVDGGVQWPDYTREDENLERRIKN